MGVELPCGVELPQKFAMLASRIEHALAIPQESKRSDLLMEVEHPGEMNHHLLTALMEE